MKMAMQTTFDNAGRTMQVVEAYGTASARTTNWTYTLDNLIATMTAVNPTTGNQTTTWTYGTSSSSSVFRNDLLASVAYPDSSSGSDVVSYAYNRQGQQRTITDQRGTIRTFYYDVLGRPTNDCVTTLGSPTDGAVLQIARAYEVRGMVSTITSTDTAAQGAGTVLNQVQFTYNDFGQLIEDQQSHSGSVASGTPNVQYAYDPAGATSNESRLNQLMYPNGRILAYNFATGMDSILNRVTSISDSSAALASYTYLGAGTVVRITYPQPGIWLDLWGGTSGVFNGFDQFGRIIDQRWQNGITTTPVDIDRYQYGYDQNSNRLYKANVVGTAAVSSGLDEYYTYDPLNRLTEMQRGVLNSTKTGISGTPSVVQDWTLDATGNWSNFTTLAHGTTNLNQTRTANKVNEIINITETAGPTWIVPAYDAVGNTITIPELSDPTQSLTAVYDAWNRMVSISAGTTSVGKYQYDGRNFRIVKQTYTSGTLTETRDFYFTSNWQDIEEQVSGSMVDQYVWAPRSMVEAGIMYVDQLICRDDTTPQRLYAMQDANFNLTSISVASTGIVVERYLYDPYGSRTITDSSWRMTTTSGYDWSLGPWGLRIDPKSALVYNRHRLLLVGLGAYGRRDPAGYFGGRNLYEFLATNPTNYFDPFGLVAKGSQGARPVVGDEDPPESLRTQTLNGLLALLNQSDSNCPECLDEASELATALTNAVQSQSWQIGGNTGNVLNTISAGYWGNQCLDWQTLMKQAIRSVQAKHPKTMCFSFNAIYGQHVRTPAYFSTSHAYVTVSGSAGTGTIDPWPTGGSKVLDGSQAPSFPAVPFSGTQSLGPAASPPCPPATACNSVNGQSINVPPGANRAPQQA